jgi:hypothetical protein
MFTTISKNFRPLVKKEILSDKRVNVPKIEIRDIANNLKDTPLYKKEVPWIESAFLRTPSYIISDDTKISKFPHGKEYSQLYKSGLYGVNAANQYYQDYGSSNAAKNQYYNIHRNSLGGKTKKYNKKKSNKKKSNKKKSKTIRRLK